MAAFLLLLYHLGYSGKLLKRTRPPDFQVCAQNARVIGNHPLLNIAILQNIEDLMADQSQCLLALLVGLKHFKILRFRIPLYGVAQGGRFRVPFPALLKPVIGLSGEKIGVEDVAQFVGIQTADLLVPLLPGLVPGHTGMSSIDPDQTIIGASCPAFFWFPYSAYFDTPPIAIAFCLGGGDILKVGSQGARGKELPVSNGLLLLCNQLFDLFVIHSCQE